jgi:phospholipase C
VIRPTPRHGHGGTVKPFHFTSLTENGGDPNHDWDAIHSEWDHGRMAGFYTTDGKTAMGYYKSSDLPYYYSLFPQFTPCANYFCGVLSETYPQPPGVVFGHQRREYQQRDQQRDPQLPVRA